jgi:hypothetical protein
MAVAAVALSAAAGCAASEFAELRADTVSADQSVSTPAVEVASLEPSPSELDAPQGLEAARSLATGSDFRPKPPVLRARPDGPDEKELPLEALRVAVALEATRARTLVDCTFANPYSRQLQGTLEIELPDGASPRSLAMFLGGGPPVAGPLGKVLGGARGEESISRAALLPPALVDPRGLLGENLVLPQRWNAGEAIVDWGELRPAQVVEQARGKVVFESVTRRRVDPALLEDAGGHRFATKVFPILAGARKRIVFVYDQPVRDLGPRALVAAPVPATLPPAFRLEVAAEAAAFAQASLVARTSETTLALEGDFFRATPDTTGEGSYLLAATPRSPSVAAGFATRADVPGTLVHARIHPKVSTRESVPTGTAVFLLDTSRSERARAAPIWGKLLRAILERDASIERFAVVSFDVAARPLFSGFRANVPDERARTLELVRELWLEGATNLDAALEAAESRLPEGGATFFLLSDGQATWGVSDPAELERIHPRAFAARWIAYQVGDTPVNRPLLERLTRAGRLVSVPGGQDLESAALAHRRAPTALRGVRIEGVAARDVIVAGSPRALFPGQVLEVAFRADGDARRASIVVETDERAEIFPLEQATPSETAGRAWAELTANALLAVGDEPADRAALALSQRFGLVNRVASLLVLENDRDVKEYETSVLARLDLGALSGTAQARKDRRPPGAPDTSALDESALETIARLRSVPREGIAWRRPPSRSGPSLARPALGDRVDPVVVQGEAQRHFEGGSTDDGVKILSAIVEENPRDVRALRLAAFTLLSFGRAEDALSLFVRARELRPFEPQALLEEALALEALGRAADAALRYECVLAGKWDGRYGGFAVTAARRLYGRLLGKIPLQVARDRSDAILLELPAAHEVYMFQTIEDTYIDLHVDEGGFLSHEVAWNHPQGRGTLVAHDTRGLGPETYLASNEPSQVFTHYWGTWSTEGTVPGAVLVVYFRPNEVLVRSTVLGNKDAKVVLWERGASRGPSTSSSKESPCYNDFNITIPLPSSSDTAPCVSSSTQERPRYFLNYYNEF